LETKYISSLVLDLTSGTNPSLSDAHIYGGVPGIPDDVYHQWAIMPQSNNSVRYVSFFPTRVTQLH